MKIIRKILDDDCPGLAAQMAFHFMLSFIPALIFMVALFALIGTQQRVLPELIGLIYRVAPARTAELLHGITETVFAGASGKLALLGLVLALWTASNAAHVAIKALNVIYRDVVERQRHFMADRFMALGVVSVLGLGLIAAANLIVFSQLLLSTLKAWVVVDTDLVSGWRWPLFILGMVIFSAATYKITPSARGIPWRFSLPGAGVFVVMWFVISFLFSFYVENFGRFNEVYGTLAGVMMLMVWFYLSSLAFLVGGEVNAMMLRSQLAD